jgi:hypothetical protein
VGRLRGARKPAAATAVPWVLYVLVAQGGLRSYVGSTTNLDARYPTSGPLGAVRAGGAGRTALLRRLHHQPRLRVPHVEENVANRTIGGQKIALDEGQIPNCHGVRGALGTGYHPGEVNRRASGNGIVSSSPTEIPSRYDSQRFLGDRESGRGVYAPGCSVSFEAGSGHVAHATCGHSRGVPQWSESRHLESRPSAAARSFLAVSAGLARAASLLRSTCAAGPPSPLVLTPSGGGAQAEEAQRAGCGHPGLQGAVAGGRNSDGAACARAGAALGGGVEGSRQGAASGPGRARLERRAVRAAT